MLESELHAIYLVTPYSVCNQMADIDWLLFLEMLEKLPAPLQRVANLVGINDSFVVKAMRAVKKVDYKLMQIHKRFFIALALQELVNELPITEVAIKYKMSRGILQSLQQMAGTFAGIVTAFCNSLNWTMLAVIVAQFKERLFFGIHPDLMDLMRISSLNSQRARALFKNGIETLAELAQSSVFVVEKILYDQAEFQSEKQREGEQEFETKERNKIRNFFVTGRMGLTVQEGAALVIKEAQDFLTMEMGMQNVKWRSQELPIINPTKNAEEVVEIVKEKAPLKRHSTEELLDDMVCDTKRSKAAEEGSYGTKFSTDLFDLETELVERKPSTNLVPAAVAVLESDSTLDDETVEQELVNRSHLMYTEKMESDTPVNFEFIRVIKVCGDLDLFNSFKRIILDSKEEQKIGLALGVTNIPTEEVDKKEPNVLIGGHAMIRKTDSSSIGKLNDPWLAIDEKQQLSGISVCLSSFNNIVFYIDLHSNTLVPWDMKVDLICSMFQLRKLTVACYNVKEQLRILYRVISGVIYGTDVKYIDPKIANWLMMGLASDHYLNQFHEMVKMYIPEHTEFTQALCYNAAKDLYATGLNGDNKISPQRRSSIESALVLQILKYQERTMDPELAAKIIKILTNVEMPMQVVLAVMECTGIWINRERWELLEDQMKEVANQLEKKIYTTYGRKFNLRSTKELKTVLGVQRGSKITVKQALETKDCLLHRLIIQHRKIGGVLNKMVYPMARNIVDNRIACQNMYFTATGRVNMTEPSIQTLAKDFEVEADPVAVTISLRSLFEPRPGYKNAPRCYVSADYCQLELRLLAHFSEDRSLLKILKSNHDVFQAIAAKWNNISESKVTDELRNDTKQMCYGIIYGMGVRSLAATLRVDEAKAEKRIEEFHATYPGIRRFIEKVLKSAEKTGFVETLNGRRRYFPQLMESDDVQNAQPVIKAQYERQAVNTVIQGSAADILKMAILKMDCSIRKRKVPNLRINTEVPLLKNHCVDPTCAVLVLHLHDELMYEVAQDKTKVFCKLLKQCMESVVTLKVPLRVKVKNGHDWGHLKEIT